MISLSKSTSSLEAAAEERYGLQSQIRRAAVLTPTNIVEGSVRHSDKHYLRYLESALGSACEVRYLLNLCIRLKMLGKHECDKLIERYTAVVKGLSALITRIDEDLQNRPTDIDVADKRLIELKAVERRAATERRSGQSDLRSLHA